MSTEPNSEWDNIKKSAARLVNYEVESDAKMNSRQFRLDLARGMLPQDDPTYRFSVKADGQDLSNPVLQVIRRADDSILAEWRGSYEANELDRIREIHFTCPSHGSFPVIRITAAEPGKDSDFGKFSYKDRKRDFLYALGKAVHIAEQTPPSDTRRVNYLKLKY